jgi:hypothetical protein
VSATSSQPYGPETAAVRGLLVRLAGLGTADRAAVVARHETLAATRAYEAADTRLGEVIARSGREQARDALSGPLVQLMKRRVADTDTSSAVGDEIALEPIAEPALAALLALMVRDLLDDATVQLLTEAFRETLPPG